MAPSRTVEEQRARLADVVGPQRERAPRSGEAPLVRYRAGDVRLVDAAEAVGATWTPQAVTGAG